MSIIKSVVRKIRTYKKSAIAISHRLLIAFGFSHSQFRRFIVLTRSRTGSNLLFSFLNSHPNVHTEGEIFRKLNGRNYQDILAKTFAKQLFHIKAKGFKIFHYHPLDDEHGSILDALASSDDLYVIHLKRRNLLRTLISRKIAIKQSIWFMNKSNQHLWANRAETTITFTVEELSEQFKEMRKQEYAVEDRFGNHPLISLDYEDLVNHREPTFRKVTEFLGIQYQQPKTNLIKMNTRSMREMVPNYEELKLAFSQTEWYPFFDE